MFLSKLRIRNFRNYKSATFNFRNGASTIIGENDSGKSNALIALRILLDDRFYYSIKTLKESDFNRSLEDWKGHWIVISAQFKDMTLEQSQKEIVATMTNGLEVEEIKENLENLNLHISNMDTTEGDISIIMRPNEQKRITLYEASGNPERFNEVRQSISISDYEILYFSKGKIDFTDEHNYKEIVGDFENHMATQPDGKHNNQMIVGQLLNMKDVYDHISVIFVDALRDVQRTLNMPNNPIKRIVSAIENQINVEDISNVREGIKSLNETISGIQQIEDIQGSINEKLIDILGLVYSPELTLMSNISDEISSISKFLNLKPGLEEEINSLGLGHLNMIFIALKIVEFNICSSRELLNIMLIEEPEAHIHYHIQKTLFQNLGIKMDSTQVIMTTHAPNISETSEISQMNIVKSFNGKSEIMCPSNNLDEFGKECLKLNISLTDSIERYLDAKRSSILFSKGVILVEGDTEEILIPQLVKQKLGLSLDEIGISIVNIGSTSFQYIAPLFSEERIKRKCAIITDLDKQLVNTTSKHYKSKAEEKGIERKRKLNELFGNNNWVNYYFADSTFELELAKDKVNEALFTMAIEKLYKRRNIIIKWKDKLLSSNSEEKNDAVLSLADIFGKGWLATVISSLLEESDIHFVIPNYIIDALSFASQETLTKKIVEKILLYNNYEIEESTLNPVNKRDLEQNNPDIMRFINNRNGGLG